MIELPEAVTLARQLNESVQGKRVAQVIAAHSPHKFAWFHGDPSNYRALLEGKTVGPARNQGGLVEIEVGDARLLFGDGVSLRIHRRGEDRPPKHQLLLEFEDGSGLSASVQMYGGLWAFKKGTYENPYYEKARKASSPLSGEFDRAYFAHLVDPPKARKLSAKGFLATEQRIPGLGNGVLQDILFAAKLHPKRKVDTLTAGEQQALFRSVKGTLAEMSKKGGRDTEKDLYGQDGGYRTKLSRNTVGQPCPTCRRKILKENYMGGAIYFCPGCQKT
jgi:formamidopyrimidine-DNA glycosylase